MNKLFSDHSKSVYAHSNNQFHHKTVVVFGTEMDTGSNLMTLVSWLRVSPGFMVWVVVICLLYSQQCKALEKCGSSR